MNDKQQEEIMNEQFEICRFVMGQKSQEGSRLRPR